ncbi:MAG: hypothetical protein KIT25_08000 [Enhydrobacter sp.]|nr:MAG: hypothetical protein KIT25_08000 [Enhydrobacter sp.]
MVDISRSPVGRARLRERLFAVIVPMASMIFAFAAAELAARAFGSDAKRWEWRNFIVEPLPLENRWRVIEPDAELGYAPRPGGHSDQRGLGRLTFDERGLRAHHDRPPFYASATPLLVVGDSYAMGEQVGDDQTFPAHLQAALGRPVLNGGVFGYGLDQIVLRAERLVPRFAPDTLVLSFIADDVRRTRMSILWGLPKPYFIVENGRLVLRNVPVPPRPSAAVGPVRSVLGYSFLADVLARRLELDPWWLRGQPLHAEAEHDDGLRVSCLLMARLRRLAETHRLRVLVVGQYTPDAWRRASTRRFEIANVAPVLACARNQGFDTLDTREHIEHAVRRDGVDRHYVDKHMSDEGNRLMAELILRRL